MTFCTFCKCVKSQNHPPFLYYKTIPCFYLQNMKQSISKTILMIKDNYLRGTPWTCSFLHQCKFIDNRCFILCQKGQNFVKKRIKEISLLSQMTSWGSIYIFLALLLADIYWKLDFSTLGENLDKMHWETTWNFKRFDLVFHFDKRAMTVNDYKYKY